MLLPGSLEHPSLKMKTDRCFSGRRTDNHQWGYAGGSIELGETVEEAAKENSLRRWDFVADEMELFISIQARRLTTSILTAMKFIMWKSYTYAANIMAP